MQREGLNRFMGFLAVEFEHGITCLNQVSVSEDR